MKSPDIWFAAGLAGTAVVFLLADGSLSTGLPLLVLLACPFMMIFLMRGMGSVRGQPPAVKTPEDVATRPVHHTPSSGVEPDDDLS